MEITFVAVGREHVGATSKESYDYMMQEVDVKEAGYAYIYVSNENATLVEFYVDDVVITHTPSNIIQYNEYNPFGIQTANSWTRENTTGNSFLYNKGSELNTTSGYYDLPYRTYDPVLGRMNGVDPLASNYARLTPYNYSFNDPVYWNDPSGATPEYSQHMYDHWKLVDGIINVDQGGGGSGGLAHIPQYGGFGGGSQNMQRDAYAVRSGQMSAEEYAMKYGTTIYQNGSFINGGEGFFYTVGTPNGVHLGYNFDGVVGKAQTQSGPSILIQVLDKPTGWDQEEYASSLRERLIANGFKKDLQITFSGWSHVKAYMSGRPTATITIKRAYLGRDPYDAGGYSTPFSRQGYVYKGLILGTDTQVNRHLDMWNYVNVTIHELGHAIFGFPDYNTKDGGPTKGIMDYAEAYGGPLINFTYEQQVIIKASKWGN